ncbi:MAG: MoaD/ThiS family protein [Acidobacteria bacterium]|nr:MoaD/ThiS family protein [Acidobacteriota bacterium]
MAITVEFLSLPNIVKMVGSKTITMDFTGQTVEELILQVTEKYGSKVRQFLLDENGRLDMILKVLLNKEEWIKPDRMQRPLEDGDHVTIMLLAAGG